MGRKHNISYLTIQVEPNDDGFLARCGDIEGAFAEGDTVQEAIFNCIDVIQMIFEYRRERGEKVIDKIEELPEKYGLTLAFPVEV
ncbi:MAG TPA: hypothetical protein ENN07_08110 [candidate division Zixibacteria bacterium]|nr:hypothetical protein [candidate division Zixibacteria bacterium]